MNRKKKISQIKDKPYYDVILYIIITYTITWTILFPLSYYYNTLDVFIRELWHSCGALGPAIAGLLVIYKQEKRLGLGKLKRSLFQYAGIGLLLFSLSPLIILILSIFFEYLFGFFDIYQFIQTNNLVNFSAFLIFIIPSLSYGIFEEIGWRGYLLPALQKKNDAFTSSIIVAIIWWLWHFPLFFYRYDIFFAIFFMLPLMVFGSITFTFLYNQSNGSLILVIIFHVCYDLTTSHQISIIAIILTSILFIFIGIRAIKFYGKATLSRRKTIS